MIHIPRSSCFHYLQPWQHVIILDYWSSWTVIGYIWPYGKWYRCHGSLPDILKQRMTQYNENTFLCPPGNFNSPSPVLVGLKHLHLLMDGWICTVPCRNMHGYGTVYDRLPAQGWISRQLKKPSIMHLKLGIWAVKSCSFWQSSH